MKESTIQQQIISYLSHVATRHQIVYFAILNEMARMILRIFKVPDSTSERIVTYFKKMGLTPGIPDLQLLHKGQSYFLEVKTPTGTCSEKQKLIHKALERCGFTVYIVRSVEDVQSIIRDITGGV